MSVFSSPRSQNSKRVAQPEGVDAGGSGCRTRRSLMYEDSSTLPRSPVDAMVSPRSLRKRARSPDESPTVSVAKRLKFGDVAEGGLISSKSCGRSGEVMKPNITANLPISSPSHHSTRNATTDEAPEPVIRCSPRLTPSRVAEGDVDPGTALTKTPCRLVLKRSSVDKTPTSKQPTTPKSCGRDGVGVRSAKKKPAREDESKRKISTTPSAKARQTPQRKAKLHQPNYKLSDDEADSDAEDVFKPESESDSDSNDDEDNDDDFYDDNENNNDYADADKELTKIKCSHRKKNRAGLPKKTKVHNWLYCASGILTL